MAVSLLSHDVSDLCIGKPAVKSLPITATVGEALLSLKLSGETFIGVVNGENIVGKLCMVDLLCYLCDEINILNPGSALKSQIGVLVDKGDALVRKVETNSSILAALDAILESSSQTLVVPTRKKQLFAWLTQEDFARFFLNNIFLFSHIAPQSITSLNLINTTELLSIPHHAPALSTLPLLRSALLHNTAVAVTTFDNKLIGEISPFTLSSGDETVIAAIATLSAGDLMSYIDSSSPDFFIPTIKARLHDKGLDQMLNLIEHDDTVSFSSSSTSSASSSSDEEEALMSASAKKRKPRKMKSSSYSARMGRKSEEAIVCHPESSLIAVLVQALAHRVSYVWVVDEEDYGLVGIVTFHDVLKTFREQLTGI